MKRRPAKEFTPARLIKTLKEEFPACFADRDSPFPLLDPGDLRAAILKLNPYKSVEDDNGYIFSSEQSLFTCLVLCITRKREWSAFRWPDAGLNTDGALQLMTAEPVVLAVALLITRGHIQYPTFK